MKITAGELDRLDWDKGGGLLPAIVQDAGHGSVLMLGYMNRAALQATFERGFVVFFSRSKQRLWQKGESSGHTLQLLGVRTDCDADTLLVSAKPSGPVCHTGTLTCFGDQAWSPAAPGAGGAHAPAAASDTGCTVGGSGAPVAFLQDLEGIVSRRIAENPEGSYTARLFGRGVRRVAQKVGEEGLEVALAGAGEGDAALIGEAADLLYHLLVLLRARSLHLEQVVDELQRRHVSRTGAGPQ